MFDPILLLLWIRALELARGASFAAFLFELDTWPHDYRPPARA